MHSARVVSYEEDGFEKKSVFFIIGKGRNKLMKVCGVTQVLSLEFMNKHSTATKEKKTISQKSLRNK